MKRTLHIFAVLVLTTLMNTVVGQTNNSNGRFDWVRSYFGPDYPDGGAPANEIFGSVIDSKGNVYILGQFIGGARWDNGMDDNSRILPFSAHRNLSAVLAKISPNGETVWHKEFYSSYTDFEVYTIRMLGDTALMLYGMFRYPFDHGYNEKNEVYYMDTLLTSSERFPQPPDSLEAPVFYYALITIGLESGNLIEDHFWIHSFVKNDGSLLRWRTNYLMTNDGHRTSFNVDSEGNIILAGEATFLFGDLCDTCPNGIYYWSPTDSNISSMRLLVDGASKQLDVPLEPSSVWNWHIIKLSPHLDSVIANTYVFDSTWRYPYGENIDMYLNSIDVDVNDNIYMSFKRSQDPVDRLPVKNSDSLAMVWYSCMIRYNSALMPTGLAQVTASYTPEGYCVGSLTFLSTYYDSVTNSLFINGTSGRNPQYTTLNFNGDTLNLFNNACWLRLDADDLSLISYGKARSTATRPYERTLLYDDKYMWSHNGSFIAKDNRVFCQVLYECNILFNDTQINSPYGMGLFIWDYDGREIAFIDYNSNGIDNEHAYIHLKDSSVWLSGTFDAAADLGSFHINADYNSTAYLARYTDTAFMTPYVYDSTGGDVRITVVGDDGAFVAYPNPFQQRITIEAKGCGPLKEQAWLTDPSGRSEEVRIIPTGDGRYSLDLTGRPQSTYLLILATVSGKRHTVRLMKMNDVFNQ